MQTLSGWALPGCSTGQAAAAAAAGAPMHLVAADCISAVLLTLQYKQLLEFVCGPIISLHLGSSHLNGGQ